MNNLRNVSGWVGRAAYGIISLSLGLISLAMIGVAIWGILISLHQNTLLVTALLDAIGLIVIGMAVFDVAKFLLEEEVLEAVEVKSPEKQRETLIKFLVIISIAVTLEALVFIFDAGKRNASLLIYPTFLLIAAVLLVVGLGVYQKLSRNGGE
jgi:uncharacterized membrane protein YidH (DUF202 family)